MEAEGKGKGKEMAKKAVLKFIREQEAVEEAKVGRHRGITKRYGKRLL